jgi:two-component system, OmpR family, alkaline phosphatase synthesis response regulator PhoP
VSEAAGADPVRRPRARLLLAEDEPSLVTTLTDRLRAEGYAVEAVRDGEAALRAALAGAGGGSGAAFDLLVLDVMLPGRDGFEVCRELRRQGSPLPVLMLTARTQVVDRVVGLKLGADDYLTKPFETVELLARIEALLRRAGGGVGEASGAVTFGDVQADFRRGQVRRGGVEVAMAPRELELLQYFAAHPGEVLSRNQLLDEVWGYDAAVQSRTVDVHVAALRQKLEEDAARPRFFRTVHGRGYRFVP